MRVEGVPGLEGGALVVRPRADGRTVGRFPFPTEPVHVLTAHDPGPVRLAPEENGRRQAALVASLDGRERYRAVAGAEDGSHAEESVLVVGLTDAEARAIGATWGQDAVFRWTRDAWEIDPCDGGPAARRGWETRVEEPQRSE